jgi:hypothetical protein
MAHVEELRQIHADINAMETIIKQAEESRRAAQVNIFILVGFCCACASVTARSLLFILINGGLLLLFRRYFIIYLSGILCLSYSCHIPVIFLSVVVAER